MRKASGRVVSPGRSVLTGIFQEKSRMAYFRVLSAQLALLQSLLVKEESWAILITADPDALASAMALQRIIRARVKSVTIARTNEISRPDNLAMIRYLNIPW